MLSMVLPDVRFSEDISEVAIAKSLSDTIDSLHAVQSRYRSGEHILDIDSDSLHEIDALNFDELHVSMAVAESGSIIVTFS